MTYNTSLFYFWKCWVIYNTLYHWAIHYILLHLCIYEYFYYNYFLLLLHWVCEHYEFVSCEFHFLYSLYSSCLMSVYNNRYLIFTWCCMYKHNFNIKKNKINVITISASVALMIATVFWLSKSLPDPCCEILYFKYASICLCERSQGLI